MLLNTYNVTLSQSSIETLKKQLKIETVSQFMLADPQVIADTTKASVEQIMEIRQASCTIILISTT